MSEPTPTAPDDVEGWEAWHASHVDPFTNPLPPPKTVGAAPWLEEKPYAPPPAAPPPHLDPPVGMAYLAERPDYNEWAQDVVDWLDAEKGL